MAQLNLLPWREELRKQRQLRFGYAVLAAVAATVIVMICVHLYINHRISVQTVRNKFLDNKIAELNRQIKEIEALEAKKSTLKAKLEIIQTLQLSRPEIVRLFNEIAAAVPEGIFLESLDQVGSVITVTGITQSNARVSGLMQNIENSPHLIEPELAVIQASNAGGAGQALPASSFRLKLRQKGPNQDQDPLEQPGG